MLKDIVLLKYVIDNSESDILNIYLECVDKSLIQFPMIFTDRCDIIIPKIPIFHTYYINHAFRQKKILIDHNDHKVAHSIYNRCGEFVVLQDNHLKSNNHSVNILNNSGDLYDRLQQIIRY